MFRTVFAIAAAFALATMGWAQAFSNHATVINAGVVILDSDVPQNNTTALPYSAGPFAFYNLDAANAIKPAGWSFQNPLAPSAVTPPIQVRWQTLNPANVPALGEKITKRDAAYWEVFLDNVSDADLSNFNILLVNPHAYLALNSWERERLRRFVDGGGVLWVDPAGFSGSGTGISVIDEVNNLPVGFTTTTVISANLDADYTQPILQTPYALTSTDISLLDGSFTTILKAPNQADYGNTASNLVNYFGSSVPDYFTLQPYSNNGSDGHGNYYNTGVYTRIGDGFVVVTARGASLKLNRPRSVTNYFGNNSYYAQDFNSTPVLGPDGIAAAKLAINMISLTAESRQSQQGSRKSNSSGVDLDAPLLERFSLEGTGITTTAPNDQPTSTPAFYKGLMFVTAGNVLYAYDAHPSTDLDGDGNPDDGIVDYSVGAPYDLVWKATIPGNVTLSSPACAEIANFTNKATRDQVWVQDSTGTLWGFNALPTKNGFYSNNLPALSNLPPFTSLPNPTGTTSFSKTIPPAPTIHEEYVYVPATQLYNGVYNGQIWIVDARTGMPLITGSTGGNWSVGGIASGNTNIGDISGSPIVGYIPIFDNSGGDDKVVYFPFRHLLSGSTTCGITSLWLGARGEVPIDPPTVTTNSLQIDTRASREGLSIYTDTTGEVDNNGVPDPRSVKLSISVNGAPLPAGVMAQMFQDPVADNGSGTLTFTFTSSGYSSYQTYSAEAGFSVRVDYSIDWGKNNTGNGDITGKVKRGQGITFPDIAGSTEPPREIIGNLAMSPRGTLYAVVADPNYPSGANPLAVPGGSFYALREQGYGVFNIVERYSLYPKHNIVLNQALPTSYDEVLFDKDPINSIVEVNQLWTTSVDRRMSDFVFTGGPTVRNGEVFVSAQARKNLHYGANNVTIPNVPVTILLAFAAEPVPAEIAIGTWPTGSQVVQPDFDRSSGDLTNPTAETTIQYSSPDWTYDADSGFLQFTSLADVLQGPVTNCLSLSQPVVLRRPGFPDALIDPSATTGRWSPLLWYQVFQGATSTSGSGPVVTGDSVFLGMGSPLPQIFNSGGTLSGNTAVVAATVAQIPTNDVWLQSVDYAQGISGSYRSWQNQLWTLPTPVAPVPGSNAPTTGSNPYLLWPQTTGVQTFSDYMTRLNETTMGNSTANYGIAAGNGTLAAVGDKGVYAFDRADFLVCEDGRLARLDPGGNLIQLIQGFTNSGPGGVSNAGVYKPLVRATKGYDLDGNTSLVVDTGGNRIIKVNRAGNELRSIDSFQFDPNYGNPSNQSQFTNIWPREGGFLNESTHLKAPSDVYTYSEYVSIPAAGPEVTLQAATEYWTHYLIADRGNNRLVELIDRFQVDPASMQIGGPIELPENLVKEDGTLVTSEVPQVGVCLWHSPALVSGSGFSYNSISRVFIPPYTPVGAIAPIAGRFVYVAGIGNATTLNDQNGTNQSPNSAPGANGLGGVVVFDPLAPNFAQVYNTMYGFPNLTDVPFWDFTKGVWDTTTPLSVTNLGAPSLAAPLGQQVQVPFSNVASVTAKLETYNLGGVVTPYIAIMVAESDGVYEVQYLANQADTAQTLPGGLNLDWYLPSQVYRSLRNTGVGTNSLMLGNPTNLNATYAKRLDNGDVLIVNGYSGTFYPGNTGSFTGEVIEVNGNPGVSSTVPPGSGFGYNTSNPNLGFGIQSLRLVLGAIQGGRQLVLPSFADRR
jgi:hypothetical protein